MRLMRDSGVEWLGEVPEHWEILKIQRVLFNIEQGSSPVASNVTPTDGKPGVIKISAIKKGRFNQSESKALLEKDFEKRYQIHLNDLLVTRGNTPELVADACVVDIEPTSRIMLSDLVYRLNINKKVDSRFLCYWLLSSYGRMQIQNDARGSSMTMAKISQGHIKCWTTTLPPINEQLNIVEHIIHIESNLDNIMSKSERMIDLLKERRTTLISAAVTGKIDVRNFTPDSKQTPNSTQPQKDNKEVAA